MGMRSRRNCETSDARRPFGRRRVPDRPHPGKRELLRRPSPPDKGLSRGELRHFTARRHGMFGLGHWEVVTILLVVLLIFGTRLPQVARSIGRSIRSFKEGLREVDVRADLDDA
ncbi:MAG: twin-arginine translocase TatA/TatE family subunit, partial [Planctomycetota bacterium]